MLKKHEKLPALSVFFPAFNEEENLRGLIRHALESLPLVARKFEIIIVDDGSIDQTLKAARSLARKHKDVRVVTQKNLGYGGALKRGFSEAKYEWIFYSDADLQFDLNELSKFVYHAKKHQLVIGYRHQRAEGLKRHLIAQALKIWNRIWLSFPLEIKDIDCAFKLIHQDVLSQIQPLESNGAMISTELLLKSHLAGYKYKQIGVSHYPREFGQPTGNNLTVIINAIKETFKLRQLLLTKQTHQAATI